MLAKKLTRPVVGSLVGCVHCGMCNDALPLRADAPRRPEDDPVVQGGPAPQAVQVQLSTGPARRSPGGSAPRSRSTDDDLDDAQGHRLRHLHQLPALHAQLPDGRRHRDAQPHDARPAVATSASCPRACAWSARTSGRSATRWACSRRTTSTPSSGCPTSSAKRSATPTRRIPDRQARRDVIYTINPREVKYDPRTIAEAAQDLLRRRRELDDARRRDGTRPTSACSRATTSSAAPRPGASTRRSKELGSEAARHLRVRPRLPLDALRGAELGRASTSRLRDGELGLHHAALHQGRAHQGRHDRKHGAASPTTTPATSPAAAASTRSRASCSAWWSTDFRRDDPQPAENYCCTGGGGAMSMSEYTPRRLRLGQGQGRPDRGHRRQDRGHLVPQLRRRADRPHQALQARLRGQAARGPGRRRARHRGVRA